MRPAVVLDFQPRLGDFVEELQRQFRHAVEHLHQASFEGRPETLLLAVLVRTVGQRLLVNDPQSLEPLGEFLGDHRSPIVGHERSGQTAFLDGLGRPVGEVLGRLGEVPLQMAAQSRMIVQDTQSDRKLPLAAGREDLQPAVVEIAVPQRADVLGFVAADLTLFAALGRQDFAGAALNAHPRLAEHAVALHVSAGLCNTIAAVPGKDRS